MDRTIQIVTAILESDPDIGPDMRRAVLDVLRGGPVRVRAGEAARLMGISRTEFYRKLPSLNLTRYVLGRRCVLYDRNELMRGVANNQVMAATGKVPAAHAGHH